ncbi:neuronal acetylcholine receptor subunit alpha-7-like [Ylistrum balloti]|uniref:neuronal acetylcholine receptor subunit alpha-7-like n=1 Tax=Ylistrum balloti TaxID=509963 RepID=UPI002905C1F2|nr:neuronal acetylcholine receptor subunit alpha-7-like [Ylistrum balloti]
MTTAQLISLLMLLSAGQSVLGRKGTMDDWARLLNTLTSNYTKEIYPVYNLSETLTISMGMFLLSILDFNEVSGVISLNGGVNLNWIDFRLAWNPSEYGGLENILLNSSFVWTPKIFLMTTADDMEPFYLKDFEIRVYHDGRCSVAPGRRMMATCSVDMSQFPIDSHICELILLQWGAFEDETLLKYQSSRVFLSYYTHNGEWDLTKSYVTESQTMQGGLSFTIYITRRPMYWILSLIIPVLLLCFLNPFVFLLPASSGERISYTVTMFLSLAVYMTLIGDNLPKVSENMAFLSFFLLITLTYSGLLVILTIFTLRGELLSDVSKFPRCLRYLALCFKKIRRTRRVTQAISQDDSEKEESEKTYDVSDNLLKDDVMRVTDMLLFVTSLSAMLVITVCFFSALFR